MKWREEKFAGQECKGMQICFWKEPKIKRVRLVFYEELDLFGFDKYFEYERTEEPLLYRYSSTYYDKEFEKVCRIEIDKDKAEIKEIKRTGRLEPIDVREYAYYIKEKEEKAKEIIRRYAKDGALVAFSGGKDSTAVLLLVKEVYEELGYDYLLFSIVAGMESILQEEFMHRVEALIGKETEKVKANLDAEYLWKYLGPPSQRLRWCTSILKLVPRKEYFMNKDIGVIFSGVRRNESLLRREVGEVREGERVMVVNPIYDWFELDVYLFIMNKGKMDGRYLINDWYRRGIDRIGCVLCPFFSKRSFYLMSGTEEKEKKLKSYLNLLLPYERTKNDKVWTIRLGGRYLDKEIDLKLMKEGRNNYLVLIKHKGKIKKEEEFWLKFYKDFKYEIGEEGPDFKIAKTNIGEEKIIRRAILCLRCGVCKMSCKYSPYDFDFKEECLNCKSCLSQDCFADLCTRFNKSKPKKNEVSGYDPYIGRGFDFSLAELIIKRDYKGFLSKLRSPIELSISFQYLIDFEILKEKKWVYEVAVDGLEYEIVLKNLIRNSIPFKVYHELIQNGEAVFEKYKEELKKMMEDLEDFYIENSWASINLFFQGNPQLINIFKSI